MQAESNFGLTLKRGPYVSFPKLAAGAECCTDRKGTVSKNGGAG